MGANIILAIVTAVVVMSILPWIDDLRKWYISKRLDRVAEDMTKMLKRMSEDNRKFQEEFDKLVQKESEELSKVIEKESEKHKKNKRDEILDFHDKLNSEFFDKKPYTVKIATPKRKSDTIEDQINNLKEDIMNHIRLFEMATGKEVVDMYLDVNKIKLVDGTTWSVRKDIHVSYMDKPKIDYEKFI